ncbi:hypothetical protein VNO77_30958 [Canavalia gladiata]|uniref:Uncharacterized protein n=1 Tax=Canavalia gladiata TaxID=3824 RepID=A0AAN9Q7I3_CANGL
MERSWWQFIFNHLRGDPEDHNFLLTESPLAAPENRDWLHNCEMTGIMVDVGDEAIHVIPVADGYVIGSSIKSVPIARKDVTHFVISISLTKNQSSISSNGKALNQGQGHHVPVILAMNDFLALIFSFKPEIYGNNMIKMRKRETPCSLNAGCNPTSAKDYVRCSLIGQLPSIRPWQLGGECDESGCCPNWATLTLNWTSSSTGSC